MTRESKPLVLITGISGDIGTALAEGLKSKYLVAGMDLRVPKRSASRIAVDLTSEQSIELAFRKFRRRYGGRIASVIHLAAYFDFTGEEHPLYRKLNVEGTRHLLKALQAFDVEQFVFTGTMLVHRPCQPGERIDEDTPVEPKWAYPKSKAATEAVIEAEHGGIPYVLLRLAGLYDERTAVPTLSQQIARIYERDAKSHLYAGDRRAGQSLIHEADLVDLVRRIVERRGKLPKGLTLLAGEPDPMGYQALQDRIGALVHSEARWPTFEMPKTLARFGAWVETASEPIVPDDFDKGEKPFIRPFMIDMASDHYALDISRARKLVGWEPRHSIEETLPRIVEALKRDPFGWYEANGITPPDWLDAAHEKVKNPELLRRRNERAHRRLHRQNLWAPFLNMGLGAWLLTSPPMLGYESSLMVWSDVASGIAVMVLGLLSLSWRQGWARWLTALVGLWVVSAPLVFWAPTAAAYLNDTLVGSLIMGLAVLIRPTPGVSIAAAESGPTTPPGWEFSPSSWFQRLPIIILAFVGLFISRYLAAYQLGHIEGVWEPFFAGGPDPKNGTEEIITSSVSEAWPVPDAGLGALVYLLEILTGIIGSARRWRTVPWLVIAFGIMIVPLGVVSITFIVIQPLVIGTWCTLCLIAAAAMLLQIPYSLDELVATGQFLWRRHKAGRPLLLIFLVGDTDEGRHRAEQEDDFEQAPAEVVRHMLSGGIGLPWNVAACLLIGAWLMFTRLTLGTQGGMADADHLIGSLVITISVIAMAEVARPVRFLNMALGLALLVTPFVYGAAPVQMLASLLAGIALIVLSGRRGPVESPYGGWSRFIV